MDKLPNYLANPSASTSAGRREPHRVAIVVPPNVVPLDLVVPLQVFGPWPPYLRDRAGGSDPYQVELVALEAECGPWLAAKNTSPLSVLEHAQTILVPGVDDPLQATDPLLLAALRRAHDRGTRIVSICTGAFTLAAAGLLDGRRATTHWHWADDLARRHPSVDVTASDLYVVDGSVVTSAGILAGADLCLYLLREDLGQTIANAMSRFLVSPPHRDGGQAQYIEYSRDQDRGLNEVMDWIRENLAEPLSLQAISQHCHMSTRTLRRRFKAATGTSVVNWIILQRVAWARELLETTDATVDEIAMGCGFGSAESFRLHFVRHTMTTPGRYRRVFGSAR